MTRWVFGCFFSLLLFSCQSQLPVSTITAATPSVAFLAPSPTSHSESAPSETAGATPTAESTAAAFPPPTPVLSQIASGLSRPDFLTNAGDGSGRLFLVEKPGTIRIIKDGALLADLFLDIRDRTKSSGTEQGLLGLAFDPQYPTNRRFYINYTDRNGNTVVARYLVSSTDPQRADPATESVILHINQPFINHNGGDLVFGPDGYLYIGMGDGGSEGDPQGNGQRLDTLLGKLLRIDVRAEPYAVPPDNPFVRREGARPEIWAYGLRNPWRFSFDRATGDLYIGDVGQDQYEEIDVQAAGSAGGQNYGWNIREGLHPYRGSNADGLVPPVAEYQHLEGDCSVTGGYVYRGAKNPRLQGTYLFGDYCTGRIWVLRRIAGEWRMAEWFDTGLAISSFGEDESGELYALDYKGGVAYLLKY